jgi:hypothetical protein
LLLKDSIISHLLQQDVQGCRSMLSAIQFDMPVEVMPEVGYLSFSA